MSAPWPRLVRRELCVTQAVLDLTAANARECFRIV